MAYIPQDDEETQGQAGMDVLAGGSPTQQQPNQQSGQQQGQSPQVVSGQGSSIGGGANAQPSAAQQQAPAPKKSKGSGMYNDLRKYRQANVPKAGQMAQAITGKQQRAAQQIGNTVQKQQQQYQQRIGEQQAKMNQAREFATQQLAQAGQSGQMGGEEDINRFRNLVTGQTRFTDVGNLGISQQQAKAQQLGDLAKQADRASGARNLLQRTFGEQNQYTRGQKGLDELILGADAGARRQVTQGTQQAAQGINEQIRDARMKALQEARNLAGSQDTLRENLQQQLTGAREGVQSEVEQTLASKQESMRQQQAAMEQAFATGQISAEQLQQFTTPEALEKAATDMERLKEELIIRAGGQEARKGWTDLYRDEMIKKYGQDVVDAGYRMASSPDYQSGAQFKIDNMGNLIGTQTAQEVLDNYRNQYKEGLTGTRTQAGVGATIDRLAKSGLMSMDQINKVLGGVDAQGIYDRIEQRAAQLKSDPKNANVDTRQIAQAEAMRQYQQAQQEALEQAIGGIGRFNPEVLTQQIQQDLASRGASPSLFKQYVSAADPTTLTQSDVITDEQLARQKALAALAGQQGTGVQERTERSFAPGSVDLAGLYRALRGV